MISHVDELIPLITVQAACEALVIPRSVFYRAKSSGVQRVAHEKVLPARALQPAERQSVLDILDSTRFQDQAPREVYATLLDEQTYLCHWRTMYRILAENQQIYERRNQLRRPVYVKPELLATGPNQVWSWDITALRGPDKWTSFYLYDLMDVYSRYAIGWLIATTQSAALAGQLIAQSYAKYNISPGQLTIHADNGAPMRARTVSQLMADLAVTESHSRPHVSDDNPFSESKFKTMKYRPDYPERFAGLLNARTWARPFYDWYNYAARRVITAVLAYSHPQLSTLVTRPKSWLRANVHWISLMPLIKIALFMDLPVRNLCLRQFGSIRPATSRRPSHQIASMFPNLFTEFVSKPLTHSE